MLPEMRNGWVASRLVKAELSERDADGSSVDLHRIIQVIAVSEREDFQ